MNSCEVETMQKTEGLSFWNQAEHSRKAYFLFWSVIAAVTAMMSLGTLASKSYLGNNDAFYYLSIADNWLENGTFLNGVTTPDGPVITPQNGIVGVFAILRMISLTGLQCLLTVVGLNFILLLSCFYPLIRICKSAGLQSRVTQACIVVVFVSSLRIFMWLYLSPVNDMIFYTGQLWLLYILVLIFQRPEAIGPRPLSCYWLSAGAVALTAVLVHFRLNAIFVPLAGIAAAILARRFRSLPLMIAMLIAAVLSLAASCLVVDRYDFQASAGGLARLMDDFAHQVYILSFRLIPESLFRDLQHGGNLLYLPFYVSLLAAFIHGIRRRNIMLLILVFICVQMFALILLHGHMTERYLWAVAIFMYILLFRIEAFRPIGVLFVVAMLINSAWTYGYKPPRLAAWQNLNSSTEVRCQDAFMISMWQRECWYYTGMRSPYNDQYTWRQLANARTVYIVGPQDYVDGHLATIKEMAGANARTFSSRQIDYETENRSDMLLYEVLIDAPSAESGPL